MGVIVIFGINNLGEGLINLNVLVVNYWFGYLKIVNDVICCLFVIVYGYISLLGG